MTIGGKLGPYQILERIGKGGMGEVYKAHDPRLRRDVAIKVCAEKFNERFEREARAVHYAEESASVGLDADDIEGLRALGYVN